MDVPLAGEVPAPRKPDRGWLRAAALFVLALAISISRPSVLVGVPYLLMLVTLPVLRWPAYTLGILTLALVLTGEREGLWWVERGWALLVAAWFVALTLRWPASRFLSRALGAVGGAVLASAALVLGRSGGWEVLDWQVGERLRSGLGTALEAMRLFQEIGTLSPALVTTVYSTAEAQAQVFPALTGLASLASLGVAWWVYVRIALGNDRALLPLREFRFNDQLVWLFIAGLILMLVESGEALRRAGSNAVVFMGALYALRGAAVVVFFSSGQNLLEVLLLAVALLLMAPVVLAGALVIGLGDTWLDLRRRARELTA